MKFGRKIVVGGAMVFLLAGIGLTVLNLSGLGYLPARHPETINTTEKKSDVALQSPQAVFQELQNFGSLRNGEDARKLTRIFASGIMHYAPGSKKWDDAFQYRWRENWVVALAQHGEKLLIDAGLVKKVRFGIFERYGYHAIISEGVGLCSQSALALYDYLRQKEIPSFILTLDGHVVVVAGPLADGKKYIMDADYAVSFQADEKAVENDPAMIEPAYIAAGYDAKEAARLAGIYGPKGNGIYKMMRIEWLVRGVKWVIPVVMILLGGAIMWFGLRRKNA